jgi:hypothetical protein
MRTEPSASREGDDGTAQLEAVLTMMMASPHGTQHGNICQNYSFIPIFLCTALPHPRLNVAHQCGPYTDRKNSLGLFPGKGFLGKREPTLRELVEAASGVMTDEVLDATA